MIGPVARPEFILRLSGILWLGRSFGWLSSSLLLPRKGIFTMRLQLASVMTGFQFIQHNSFNKKSATMIRLTTLPNSALQLRLLIATVAVLISLTAAQPVQAVDFFATNGPNKGIYGVNIDGTASLIGTLSTTNGIFDIATNPVDQSTYLLESLTSPPISSLLYSAVIGSNSVSSSLIGSITSTQLIEGGIAFSSFQGTNTLYASGILIDQSNNPNVVLQSVNTTTGQGTIISSGFLPSTPSEYNDIHSIFNAPDGRLWGLTTYINTGTSTTRTDLFRFATNGTVDRSVTITGFDTPLTGGVAVKNGVTYYLTSPQGFAYSSFGTLGWDSINQTYTGSYNLISNTIIGGMTGLTLATTTVPEPSTYALGAIATGVMAAIARRRKARRV
jgi:hypothetical protein